MTTTYKEKEKEKEKALLLLPGEHLRLLLLSNRVKVLWWDHDHCTKEVFREIGYNPFPTAHSIDIDVEG